MHTSCRGRASVDMSRQGLVDMSRLAAAAAFAFACRCRVDIAPQGVSSLVRGGGECFCARVSGGTLGGSVFSPRTSVYLSSGFCVPPPPVVVVFSFRGFEFFFASRVCGVRAGSCFVRG
jgi:hypothetical protein